MLNALLLVWELASVNRMVKLLVPEPVGVPEITPVAAASVNPAGRVPALTVQEYGVWPPAPTKVVLYGVP